MGTRLSPETEAALRELAREIGRARDLGEEALEELYGHLEDKTLGYLSGEEGITEADAVLLTREHFGDPGAFPEAVVQMQTPFRSSVSLPRRLTAVAVLTLVVGITLALLRLLVAISLDAQTTVSVFDPYSFSRMWITPILYAGAIFLVLRSWNAREHQGLRVWYQHRTPGALTLTLLALIMLRWCIPGVDLDSNALSMSRETFSRYMNPSEPSFWFIVCLGPAIGALDSLLWIWWADRRTLKFGAIVAGAAAWTGLIVVFAIPHVLFGMPAFVLGESGSGFEIQSATETIATSTQSLFGFTPDNPLETTLSLIFFRTYAMGLNAAVAALAYMLVGFSARALQRLGHARTRLRPATR